MSFQAFGARKKLSQWYSADTDASIKGAVDEGALPILNVLNRHPDYLSTSSCSGRIVLWVDGPMAHGCRQDCMLGASRAGSSASAKACESKWLLVTHERLGCEWQQQLASHFQHTDTLGHRIGLVEPTPHSYGILFLKVEPYLLHIEAASAAAGQALLKVALQAGYRNSGLTLTKRRCIVAIRSTLKLDAPVALISADKKTLHWIVSPDYLSFLTCLANDKMAINEQQRHRLLRDIEASFAK